MMINFIEEFNLPMQYLDLIIPVPLHKARLREREFNQAALLGKQIAQKFVKTMPEHNLIRHRQTKTQTDLEKDKRLINVKDSFSLVEPEQIKNKNILLIDDVLTSDATCSEAALTLKKSGANIVFVLTLAN
jgi:ComF family protein